MVAQAQGTKKASWARDKRKNRRSPRCGGKLKMRKIMEAISITHRPLSCFDLKWTIGYGKIIRTMGAVFTQSSSQIQWCENFKWAFGVVPPRFRRVSAPFHNRKRNVDRLQHAVHHVAVGSSWRVGGEEG